MAAIPKPPAQELIDRIYKSYEAKEAKKELRLSRLGASSIGDECLRSIWLNWRAYAVSQFSGRMLRLFGTGHWQEARIVADLRAAGLEVWETQPNSEDQIEFIDETGHFICKVDGIVKGVPESREKPHNLEIKTHNKSSFAGLVKNGVEKSKPNHYTQMQSGMRLSGLARSLYVAVCKDDEQFHIERVREDKAEQQRIESRVIKLVNATIKPARISEDPDSFSCKFCDMKAVCHGAEPLRTCRSCVHVSPATVKGEWFCTLHSHLLSKDEQLSACAEYEVL
jgi:hypothetical protein